MHCMHSHLQKGKMTCYLQQHTQTNTNSPCFKKKTARCTKGCKNSTAKSVLTKKNEKHVSNKNPWQVGRQTQEAKYKQSFEVQKKIYVLIPLSNIQMFSSHTAHIINYFFALDRLKSVAPLLNSACTSDISTSRRLHRVKGNIHNIALAPRSAIGALLTPRCKANPSMPTQH